MLLFIRNIICSLLAVLAKADIPQWMVIAGSDRKVIGHRTVDLDPVSLVNTVNLVSDGSAGSNCFRATKHVCSQTLSLASSEVMPVARLFNKYRADVGQLFKSIPQILSSVIFKSGYHPVTIDFRPLPANS